MSGSSRCVAVLTSSYRYDEIPYVMSLAPSLAVPRLQTPPFAAAPLALALAAFALCAFAPAVLNDGDTWSHIATGEWILKTHSVPHVDPFSFTFAGQPWVAHEWLSEVMMALAYRGAGWSGVMLLTGLAAGAAAFLISRRAVAELPGPGGLLLAFGALALATPGLLARPHVLALPVLALWATLLFEARDQNRAPPLAAAALMALWANLHGGFAFGIALMAPFAIEAVVAAEAPERLTAARDWALFALLSVVAALLTPFGIDGLLFPIKLLSSPQLANIGEWRAEDFTHPGPLEIFLLGLIGFAVTKPFRLSPIRAVLLVGLIHLALQHARHATLLAVVAPMLLARPVAEALEAGEPPPALSAKWFVGAFMIALTLAGARFVVPPPRLDSASAPTRAFAAVPEPLRALPVLNSYSFGGFLIFAHIKPFIDGRADMYGARFLSLYQRIASGDAELLRATLKQYDIAWTLLAPDQRAVETLDHLTGWRRLYSDSHAVVHVREPADASAVELRRD